MSIAAISSSFVTAVRERAPVAAVEAGTAPVATKHAQHEGGRRHELVDAMKQVMGVEGETDRADDQAVFRFAHALMHDLRSLDGAATHDGPGRGHAWGRRPWSHLPQRIDALATAAGAGAVVPSPTGPMASTEPVTPDTAPGESVSAVETVAPAVVAEAPEPELPLQPNPITTTSAALHLMQVPSSRLLEAYAALRQALGDQAEAAPASASARDALAAFLDRLSEALAADTPPDLPTGSVLNLTA